MNLYTKYNELKTSLIHSENGNLNNKINSEKFRKIAKNLLISPQKKPLRISSVTLILYNKDHETQSLFIKRATYSGYHSNQYALPGGKMEKSDITTAQTAIRETHEELGIVMKPQEIIGQLDPIIIPISNYIIFPFVAFLEYAPEVKPDNIEVEKCYHYPISELFSPNSEIQTEVNINNTLVEVSAYKIQNQIIWGATAIMLYDFKNRLKNIEKIL